MSSLFLLLISSLVLLNAQNCSTLYFSDGVKCAQACVSDFLLDFALNIGFSKGNCIEQGFTILNGTHTVDLESLGNITVDIYQKSNEFVGSFILGETEQISVGPFGNFDVSIYKKPVVLGESILLGDACQNLYKIESDQCGQLCLSSSIAPYAIKFGGVTAGECKDVGYPTFDHAEQISVGPFGNFDVSIYKKTAVLGESILLGDACQNLYKIESDQCGQLCLSSSIAPYAIKFGGVIAGECKDAGYTTFDHTEKVSVGPFGNFDVSIYKKPALLGQSFLLGDSCQNLYKIENAQCGQLCLSSSIAPYAIKFGGVTAGECKDVGFNVFDHTENISVGPFGSFDVSIYKKAGFLRRIIADN